MRIAKLLRSQLDKTGLPAKITGAPPGTMVYTGERQMEDVHVHQTHFNPINYATYHAINEIPDDDYSGEITWYDVRGLHETDLIQQLGERYGMHPLALEDVVDIYQRPKMESWPDGVLLQVKAFAFDKVTRRMSIEQISIYLAKDTVLTFQEDAGDLFQAVRERLKSSSGRIRSRGADYLAYALIDNITDHYFTVLDQIEEALDELEDAIIKDPQIETKAKIHDLRLALLTMRKSTSPTRELVGHFATADHPLISEDTQVYVRDLKDHVVQTSDLVETYRDVTNGLYDLYVSEISFRTNKVMQTLTVVSTVFIPLGFLAGVFGMNFVHIPGLENPNGYYILWGIMLVITAGILLWFRNQKWI